MQSDTNEVSTLHACSASERSVNDKSSGACSNHQTMKGSNIIRNIVWIILSV